MHPEQIEDEDEDEQLLDNEEKDENINEKYQKHVSPQKKGGVHNSSKKAVKKHESPRKGEVAMLVENGKLSPLNPSRRAAEKAKKALNSSKTSVK